MVYHPTKVSPFQPMAHGVPKGDRDTQDLPSGRRTAAIGWTLVILVERMVFFKHLGEIINGTLW